MIFFLNLTFKNMEHKNIDKILGTIIGGCCGDVLGSQTEGMTRKQIIEKFGDMVTEMPKIKNYTDDSEMTLVLLRHIVKNKKIILNDIHTEYANELKNNKGYSGQTRSILQKIKNNDFPSQKGLSDHNGCIMRIAPLGLIKFKNDEDLINNISLATYYTHAGSDSSIACCYLHCKLINKLLYSNTKKNDILNYVLKLSSYHQPLFTMVNLVKYLLCQKEDIDITYELLGSENFFQIKAIHCLSIALYIFFKFYEEPLKGLCYAASLGGDTDTIAKILGDLMGALHGTKWIPENWKGIENENEMKYLIENFN